MLILQGLMKVDMTFQVEGVGYNFIPKTLEHSLISWNKHDKALWHVNALKKKGYYVVDLWRQS